MTRDAYFSCLDRNGLIQARDELKTLVGKEGKGVCGGEREGYERNCGKSWVSAPTLNLLMRCCGGLLRERLMISA